MMTQSGQRQSPPHVRVRRERQERGWSLQQVAEMVGYRWKTAVHRIEHGERRPSWHRAVALERVLHLPGLVDQWYPREGLEQDG